MRPNGANKAGSGEELPKLASISSDRSQSSVERVLGVAREQLSMEVAFTSEFVRGNQVYRVVEGDADSFGLEEDTGIPLEGTFCQRLVKGELTNTVRDARSDERVKDLDVTRQAGIGSYVGVPLRYSDGRLYGTMCCISHHPDPSLKERDAQFMKVLARLVMEQIEREQLESENWRLRLKATGIDALLSALEARDGYTGEHSQAVVECAVSVARRLGLSPEEVADVEQGALLHDVGKIGVLDSILNKPGPLDEQEWKLMKEHPVIGERIVASVESITHLALIVRAEHERWDGKGYPDGLEGEQIPLASRIVLACDAYHAMTSDRPYRRALGPQKAFEELKRNAGTQFDPCVISALMEVLESHKLFTN